MLLALLSAQSPSPCADVASCRTLALEAQQRGDYEVFHDLAWAAHRKGRGNDPAVMLLVARAQSLSGRPGDALVMLERIATTGTPTDVATSDDFARVRALPRWLEVAGKFSAAPETPATRPADVPASAARPELKGGKERPPTIEKTAPPKPEAAIPEAGKPDLAGRKPKAESRKPEAVPPASRARLREPGEPLKFTTILTPSALVYDVVSRRFIIADRQARRIAVIDEDTGQVATLVGAQGALGEIGGVAIDPQRGDLWVLTAGENSTVLHRMQLISGRVLSAVPVTAIKEPVVAMAFAGSAGLVLADTTGTIWSVRPGGGSRRIGALEYIPRALGADASGRLYVSGGAPRLARFTIDSIIRKVDTIDVEPSIPPDSPFVVAGKRVHFIVAVDGSFEIRSIALK